MGCLIATTEEALSNSCWTATAATDGTSAEFAALLQSRFERLAYTNAEKKVYFSIASLAQREQL